MSLRVSAGHGEGSVVPSKQYDPAGQGPAHTVFGVQLLFRGSASGGDPSGVYSSDPDRQK